MNPRTQFGKETTVEDVLEGPIVADPFRLRPVWLENEAEIGDPVALEGVLAEGDDPAPFFTVREGGRVRMSTPPFCHPEHV
ncbi:hypothetical protein ACYJ1Y_10425 [Natrialbaceae archaeon A-gly3]